MTLPLRWLSVASVVSVVWLCGALGFVAAQSDRHLRESAPRVQMIPVSPNSAQPFFRATLRVEDSQNKVQGLPYAAADLSKAVTVTATDPRGKCQVFSAQAPDGNTAMVTARSRYFLLLLDVSGSMFNRNNLVDGRLTRFEAAKQAVSELLQELQPDDHIAIVPFESHGVRSKIESAQFASQSGALKQLDDIKPPTKPGQANTALYAATAWALGRLEQEKSENAARLLVVLTDGKNDIQPPPLGTDDTELQGWGNDGLEKVRQLADKKLLPIWTVGISTDSDSAALKAMVYPRSAVATQHVRLVNGNSADLKRVLGEARQALLNEFQVSFLCEHLNNFAVLNRPVSFNVALSPNDRTRVHDATLTWASRDATRGRWDDAQASPTETALLKPLLRKNPDKSDKASSFSEQLLALLTRASLLSAALALLWFGAPRLLWQGASLPGAGLLPGGFKRQAPKPARRRTAGTRAAAQAPPPVKGRQRFEETQTFDQWRDRH